jgi:hypothetical protein
MKKLKEILPGIIISISISLVANVMVFISTFSTLQASVLYNAEQVKTKVGKEQFDAILLGQTKMETSFDKRLSKIEDKLDRIIERKR